ncbi:MAG: KamA family radical SAM protein [Candidatus Omnitrophota bacterium]
MSNSQKQNDTLKEVSGENLDSDVCPDDWPDACKNSIKSINHLSKLIYLDEKDKQILSSVSEIYHMRVPQYYFSLIEDPCDPHDPIRRQCIPAAEEIQEEIDEDIDPLGEEKTSPTPYLVHRYPDRALLLVTGRCFMYCRHCTRKRLWRDKTADVSKEEIDKALCYLRNHHRIREVIVSGGDPLTLATDQLNYILSSISRIKNIEAVRIGTRAPVVLPQRIDSELCRMLAAYDNLWVNVQFNHPREVTPQSSMACRKLQRCGIPVNNQSVLLKGINDSPEVMIELCHKLQNIRVRPYYLFQCDPVVGTAHFRTSVFKGVEIMNRMRGYTSGMCVPTFVVDGIDGKGKVPLAPNYLISTKEEGVVLRNYKDEVFFYGNPQEKLEAGSFSNRVRTIGITFNLKKDNSEGDEEEEYDEIQTVESIKMEIERLGFDVKLFEQDSALLDNLSRQKPDFVLNIAEGIGNSRARESQVPGILESMGIPYSGSDPVSLGITLDKYLSSRILKLAGIPVPDAFMVQEISEITRLKNIFNQDNLFIVKPRWEGSSKGIFLNSLVSNFSDLYERVKNICVNYKQPALVEEFMEKDEITAAVCGNDSPRLLGMMKIVPKDETKTPFLYSLETKRQWQDKVSYQPQSSVSLNIQKLVKKYALAAYRILELKDFARIDFRLDKESVPRIIDVNPLPGLSPRYSDLPILYRLKGKAYSELIKALLKESFQRCGLNWQ